MIFYASHAIVDELDRPDSSARDKLVAEGWCEHSLLSEAPNVGYSCREEARIFCRSFTLADKFPEYLARKINSNNVAGSNDTVGKQPHG